MGLPDGELLATLMALELALQRADVRRDAQRLDALLHADFVEFGRSGRVWGRAEIIAALLQAPDGPAPLAQDFAVRRLGDGAALLTYRSRRLAEPGGEALFSLRSSAWQWQDGRWQMVFHQGTPTAPF